MSDIEQRAMLKYIKGKASVPSLQNGFNLSIHVTTTEPIYTIHFTDAQVEHEETYAVPRELRYLT